MRIAHNILRHLCAVPLALAVGPLSSPAEAGNPPPAAKPAQKLIAFDMRGQRWDEVLEWLGDQTGLPVMAAPEKLKGKFTYIPPRGKKYTVPQIIDILNEDLIPQKFTLIQRPRSLYLISIDKDINPAMLPQIRVDQLDQHGDSELVRCVLKPKLLVAEDLVPKLKDMLGPVGKATAIGDANELILQDTVGSIRHVNDIITDLEKNPSKNAQNLAYVCKYKRASEAAATVTKLLGNPEDTLRLAQRRVGGRGGPRGAQPQIAVKVHMWHVASDDSTNTVLVNGPADKIADAKNILESIDKGEEPISNGKPLLKTYTIGNSQADAFAKVLTAKFKSATISAAGHDTLLVYGFPSDQIEIAKQIYGDQRVKTVSLPLDSADATRVASTLVGMFGDSKDAKTTGAPFINADPASNAITVRGTADQIKDIKEALAALGKSGNSAVARGDAFLKSYTIANNRADAFAKVLTAKFKSATIAAAGHDTLLVYGFPSDQMEIAKQVYGDQRVKTVSIPLESADATRTAATLIGMFGDSKDAKTAGAPFIDADPANNALTVRGTADQLKDIKEALAALGEGSEPTGSMRVITLDSGSPTTLAEELGRMMQQMRRNPIKVIIPGQSTKSPKAKQSTRPAAKGEGTTKRAPSYVNDATNQLVDLHEDSVPDRRPGNERAPVTITPLGNKLYIHSDDTQALQLVHQLSRLLTKAPTGKGDFEIIHLKNGNAGDVARTIDELFSAAPTSAQRNAPASMTPNAKPDPVRVVPDLASNSLLVQASPLNMITIRHLLDDALDTEDANSNAVGHTFIIPLRYAQASDVADVLKDVYKEHMTPDTSNLRGKALRLALANAANSNKNATLTVATDDQTNSIIVNCSMRLYKEIVKLTTDLDQGAKDNSPTVTVVPVHGVDPMMLQQVLEMMQGHTSTNTTPMPGGFLLPSVGNYRRGFNMPGHNRGRAPSSKAVTGKVGR